MGYVKDALLGFATADALGVPIEFTKRNQGEPLKEMVGFGSHPVPEGTWSDDTSMTIAAMDSIIDKKGIDYNDIMKRFLQWIQSAKYTATDEVFDMGIATRNALANFAMTNTEPTKCGVKGFNENGNGSLMRILPFVFYAYENNMNEEEVTNFINDASSFNLFFFYYLSNIFTYEFIFLNIFSSEKTSSFCYKAFTHFCFFKNSIKGFGIITMKTIFTNFWIAFPAFTYTLTS